MRQSDDDLAGLVRVARRWPKKFAVRTSREWRRICRESGLTTIYRITWTLPSHELPERMRKKALKDPAPGPGYFYTRSRQLANWCANYVSLAGGTFGIEAIAAVRCGICRRWVFGVSATVQVEVNRKAGKPVPCGHACIRIPAKSYREAMNRLNRPEIPPLSESS
jgi:hypothetical protein